jgi:hypothetical protein
VGIDAAEDEEVLIIALLECGRASAIRWPNPDYHSVVRPPVDAEILDISVEEHSDFAVSFIKDLPGMQEKVPAGAVNARLVNINRASAPGPGQEAPNDDEGVSGLSREPCSEPAAPRPSRHPTALSGTGASATLACDVRTALFPEHGAPLMRTRDNGAAFCRDELARTMSPYGVAMLYSAADTPR